MSDLLVLIRGDKRRSSHSQHEHSRKRQNSVPSPSRDRKESLGINEKHSKVNARKGDFAASSHAKQDMRHDRPFEIPIIDIRNTRPSTAPTSHGASSVYSKPGRTECSTTSKSDSLNESYASSSSPSIASSSRIAGSSPASIPDSSIGLLRPQYRTSGSYQGQMIDQRNYVHSSPSNQNPLSKSVVPNGTQPPLITVSSPPNEEIIKPCDFPVLTVEGGKTRGRVSNSTLGRDSYSDGQWEYDAYSPPPAYSTQLAPSMNIQNLTFPSPPFEDSHDLARRQSMPSQLRSTPLNYIKYAPPSTPPTYPPPMASFLDMT